MTFNRLPKRRKREPMGVRKSERIRCPSHLAWTRGNRCSVENYACSGGIEAHHVRENGNGGTGLKPGDDAVIALCAYHHEALHRMGAVSFQRGYSIDLDKAAAKNWEQSPHGIRWRMESGK